MISKLADLRALFNQHNIDGYIIPHTDEYQNEYLPESSKRLEYITGFSGSNGIALITKDKQYFWTDGRYQLQAKKEVPEFQICTKDFDIVGPIQLGYDPMLFTTAALDIFSKKLHLVPIKANLVDKIWNTKPAPPVSPLYLYPIEYSGMSARDKIQKIRASFLEKAPFCLITASDAICWLLNIRASDIKHVPIMLGYAIISADQLIIFTCTSPITDDIKSHMPFVDFRPIAEIFTTLSSNKEKILVDQACPLGLASLIKNKLEEIGPCFVPKSCKNDVEIKCAIEGHIKDAIALCEGLAWVQNNPKISEYDVGVKLTELRRQQKNYVMNSFSTIAGFKENGAIIHYNPPKVSSKVIEGDGLLLIDSGAHYLGCTTDVTRVLCYGQPTALQKRRYTQVLKGHIALANAQFPEGTVGCNLDILARQYLWQDGVDYAHGTGHGVGNMLSVHEAPGYIGQAKTNIPLKVGMIVSNEPGFYREGEFGIRIENLMYVKQSANIGFLQFETLTMVPYAKDLIEWELITPIEMEYLKEYYSKIRKNILPLLSADSNAWVEYELERCH